MAAVTDEQVETVRALVASIPAGRVSTYGDIADAAELSSPRIVGWIMRTDSSDLPWHRVISASGRPAPHLTTAAAGAAARRGCARRRRPGAAARRAPRVLERSRYRAPAGPAPRCAPRPGKAAAVDRGCSAWTASRNINARNNICGHSGSGLHRSTRPSSASPHASASTTTTPGRPGCRPPVRGDVGDARCRGAGEEHRAVQVAVHQLTGAAWSAWRSAAS